MLLEHGDKAQVKAEDKSQLTPFELAIEGHHTAVRRVFEPSSADLDAADEEAGGFTSLMHAAHGGRLEEVEGSLAAASAALLRDHHLPRPEPAGPTLVRAEPADRAGVPDVWELRVPAATHARAGPALVRPRLPIPEEALGAGAAIAQGLSGNAVASRG